MKYKKGYIVVHTIKLLLLLIFCFCLPVKGNGIIRNILKNDRIDTVRTWPIISLKLSYPQIVSLEGGFILNLKPVDENGALFGPSLSGEIGINSVKSGLGFNFGMIGFNVRPSICYTYFWLDYRGLKKRSQYIGLDITGTMMSIVKLNVGIHRIINSVESDKISGAIGFGIGL